MMRKKKNKNYLAAVLTVLIILSAAAIAYVILFQQDEAEIAKRPPGQKTPAVRDAKEKTPVHAKGPQVRDGRKEISRADAQRRPEKEKMVAKIIPPGLPVRKVAIIIDDIGYDLKAMRDLLQIDADITFGVLPLLPHSHEAARALHHAHREVLLHLPMEPLSYPKDKPGSGALFTDMSEDEITYQLEKDLDSVPYVAGVNNHMGSRFMSDETRLRAVFKQLKKRDLFFIDSRTAPSSKTSKAADKIHLTVASRNIFLDHERDYHKIYQILVEVAEKAGDGPLIVIGHPYPETIRAIRDAQKVFREKGVSIVPVSQLVGKKAARGTS